MAFTKAKCQFRHALRRAEERYPMFEPWGLVRFVRSEIKAGRSVCVHTASNRVRHHAIVARGYAVLAVYDRIRGEVVTLLPSMNLWSYALRSEVAQQLNVMTAGARFV